MDRLLPAPSEFALNLSGSATPDEPEPQLPPGHVPFASEELQVVMDTVWEVTHNLLGSKAFSLRYSD